MSRSILQSRSLAQTHLEERSEALQVVAEVRQRCNDVLPPQLPHLLRWRRQAAAAAGRGGVEGLGSHDQWTAADAAAQVAHEAGRHIRSHKDLQCREDMRVTPVLLLPMTGIHMPAPSSRGQTAKLALIKHLTGGQRRRQKKVSNFSSCRAYALVPFTIAACRKRLTCEVWGSSIMAASTPVA